LPDSNDLRLGVRGPEGNSGGANLTLAGPIRNAVPADDDPADRISRARAPCDFFARSWGRLICQDMFKKEQSSIDDHAIDDEILVACGNFSERRVIEYLRAPKSRRLGSA
jgi:hypothetical protein